MPFSDIQPPTFTFCPNDQTSSSGNVSWNNPKAVDNSGQSTVTCNHPDFNSGFHAGQTCVICSARDTSGNNATCAFMVTKGKIMSVCCYCCNSLLIKFIPIGGNYRCTPPGGVQLPLKNTRSCFNHFCYVCKTNTKFSVIQIQSFETT